MPENTPILGVACISIGIVEILLLTSLATAEKKLLLILALILILVGFSFAGVRFKEQVRKELNHAHVFIVKRGKHLESRIR